MRWVARSSNAAPAPDGYGTRLPARTISDVLTYRVGDPQQPRGHALLFFYDADDANVIWATYLVVAPIAMDLAKYIPAAFASNLPAQLAGQAPAAYPLPPMPEKVAGGLDWLDRMARLRSDDLLDGGTLRASEPLQVMHPVAEIGQQYAEQYNTFTSAEDVAREEERERPVVSDTDVDALLLQVMPDTEKVSRLARLTGTLRYAVEGGDLRQIEETTAEMEQVGRYLPDSYRVAELVATARSTGEKAGQLTQRYVERCYRLAEEDYEALASLDRRIEELKGT